MGLSRLDPDATHYQRTEFTINSTQTSSEPAAQNRNPGMVDLKQ
jgi:hypothetical protein